MPRKKKEVIEYFECVQCPHQKFINVENLNAHTLQEHADIYEKLRAGVYENKLPYERYSKDKTVWEAYQSETVRLRELFKQDLEKDFYVQNNPKKDRLFDRAWDYGHSSGYYEVANYYASLVELIQ